MRNNGKYDVFLSFEDRENRYIFSGNLYNALRRKRINTFFGDINDQRSPLQAIEESRISIVVLCPKYASSPSRLDELVAILDCMNTKGQMVFPIFYKVHMWDVRYQKGTYGEAMSKFKQRFGDDSQRVRKWRDALTLVTELSGWTYYTGYEYELIQKIVLLAVESLPRYDVFLSFSGEDTRYSFTGFLYNAFRREGFKIFMDEEGLEGGNQISEALMRAIEMSRLSIVVFSESYAYSTWCLDELAKIMECKSTNNQMVWPIFHYVEKSDVCNQTKSYGEAIAAHEKNFGEDSEKVQKWRRALSEIASLEGYHLREDEYQYEFVERLVDLAIAIENHEHIQSPSSNDSYNE
ncbi:hypothetical protein Fmac_030644 [Flemingia macrophylla]|uniref:TIR domain-containing protein n=1 Tax=Flemingia macrophylla TaxID=520843 RepID=A0ABD1KZR8_9FABA